MDPRTGMPPTLSSDMGSGILLIELVILAFIIAGWWKVFVKAGQPGWKALIPIYNIYTLCKIGGNPGWYLFLLLIPLVNIYILFAIHIGVARQFGKGLGFGLGLVIFSFIFYPILGFGEARYTAPVPKAA